MREIQKVGILGAGTMGNGIAHVFARSGIEVRLCEVEQRFLDRRLETIRKNMGREVAKSKLTQQDMDASLARIHGTLERASLIDCDFVVEAATERFGVAMGETRADGQVTLEPVYCIGLCAIGPNAIVNGRPVCRIDLGVLDLIAERISA